MVKQDDGPPKYKSYWLRCWQVGGPEKGSPIIWRFSLEDPMTRDKRGFTELRELVAFMERELVRED